MDNSVSFRAGHDTGLNPLQTVKNLHIRIFSTAFGECSLRVRENLVGSMVYERLGGRPLDYNPCKYKGSKLLFRGPQRRLDGKYVAFLGGSDTYGKFLEQPFPDLIETRTGLKCVNFGWPNAGVDVYLNDPAVLAATAEAQVTVLQVPCAQNMSNRFYSVHPRRNDRFLDASGSLRAIFREVDFTEFHFNRHMLKRLHEVSPERFGMLRAELQRAWVARMQLLLQKVNNKVILLWLSSRKPEEQADCTDIGLKPSLVTRGMLEKLRPMVADLVEVCASARALEEGSRGLRFAEFEAQAAAETLGPTVHYEAADALAPLLTDMVGA